LAKLSSKARKALPKSTFAGPGRSYPVPDKSHAANAKARAAQQVKAGNLSPGAKAKIVAKANKVLGK
jgi:translation elongation factor P/translation initiation factor 5A